MDFDQVMTAKLHACGIDPKQIGFFLKLYHEDEAGFITDEKTKQWALERGFFPGRVELYGLNENNYRMYLPDYAYFLMHPFNHHFRIWVNDKLTLKYILGNREFNAYMPKYYLYIENDGNYTYLMDSPKDIKDNDDYLINLLKKEGSLALKPNNGSEGIGFIKLVWDKERIFKNNNEISEPELKEMISLLRNYTVTEYAYQHKDLAEIWPQSECTFRIIMAKIPTEKKCNKKEWKCFTSFARFGSKLSGGASNLDAGGIGVGVDFSTGLLKENGIRYKHFCNDGSYLLKEHPDTGCTWDGKIVPNWSQVQNVVIKICEYISSLDYLGFDIIITQDSFKICEINTFPAMAYGQVMCGPVLADERNRRFFENKGLSKIDNSVLYEIVSESEKLLNDSES